MQSSPPGLHVRQVIGYKKYKAHRPKSNPTFLKPDQVDRFIAAAMGYAPKGLRWGTARNVALVYVALYAGLRVGEIHRLDVEDIDFTEGQVTVQKSKSSRRREIPLNEETMDALHMYLALRGNPRSGPLFISSRGRLAVRTIQWLIGKIGEDAGLRRRRGGKMVGLSPHKLRHTFVSMLVNDGTPLIQAAQMAGHASTKTTERYAHAIKNKEAVESISRRRVRRGDGPATMDDVLAELRRLQEKLP